jgi:hypothetical protein
MDPVHGLRMEGHGKPPGEAACEPPWPRPPRRRQTRAPWQPDEGAKAQEQVAAGALLDEEATRAEGGAAGGTMLSSARRRSAQTSAKEGKGFCQVNSCDINWKRSLKPRRMFSTRVRS